MKKLYVLTFCVLFCLTGVAQSFSPSDTMPIYLPKAIAITPSNRDGLNDYFSIPQNSLIKSLDLTIYNRSGGKVYHTTDKEFEWNGTDNGLIISGAVYFYILFFEYRDDIPVEMEEDKPKPRQQLKKGTIITL